MKHILNVDVQKKDDTHTFTLHYNKCAVTWHVKSLGEGFKKITEIVMNGKSNEVE